jgi:hypothetical protein
MIYPINRMPKEIPIGIQTENGVCIVAIDCSPWVEQWPGMVCSAMHTRPGESTAYPVICEWDGHILRWVVSMADTEIPGQGIVEIIGLANGKRKLSGKTHTKITETSVVAPGEAPEPIRPFVDHVLDAAARAEQAAKDAALHYSADDAGKLLYISADGKAIPLALGDGLQIVDGVLHVLGGGSAMVTLTVDAEGHADITGGDIASDSSGDATIE